LTNFAKYEKLYFVLKFEKWDKFHSRPSGVILKELGPAGDIIVESKAILESNCIDSSPFSPTLIQGIPDTFKLHDSELASRKDCREYRIFTIDPLTAKDLDDALHVTALENGNFEVGVHIADVSFYIEPKSELDDIAQKRSTSTYLTQECIPMLPHILCENLCSLNPDIERYAFSITWELTPEGVIVEDSQWIGRTIIKSVAKLAYQHAQKVLENFEDGLEGLKHLVSKGTNPVDVAKDIVNLDSIAKHMRKRRFDNGALSFTRHKLRFIIDPDSRMPIDFNLDKQEDSNKLIEEFMLLANMKIAEFIYKHFPQHALLRKHEYPLQKKKDELSEICKNLGVEFDVTSSKAFNSSLSNLSEKYPHLIHINEIMAEFASRSQTAAQYFCSGGEIFDGFHHYALNADIYTHFTSPIRRYADVMVHRLVFAALQKSVFGVERQTRITECATQCNRKKKDAKKAGTCSEELYLALYLKGHPLLDSGCVVYSLSGNSIYVYSPILGLFARVYFDEKASRDNKKGEDKAATQPVADANTENTEDAKESIKVNEKVKKDYKPSDFELFSVVPVLFTKKDTKHIEIRATLHLAD
jgi:VacB/RNase II family 3'-5' exoribonuclease